MNESLKNLENKRFDLVIVGGGIMGAGVAREAQMRGLQVLLLEKCDFASGTSSRSSKLIHGGIRYLANLEFDLVLESLKERTNLFDMAPNLVQPARFVLPVYKDSKYSMSYMALGMMLYDLLVGINQFPTHKRLNIKDTLDYVPFINTDQMQGSFIYSDAYTDDSRLVLETIRSAKRHGAICMPYSKVTGTLMKDGKIQALNVEHKGVTYKVKGTHFVGAVGPWTDVFANSVLKKWDSQIKPSKGVHITLERKKLSSLKHSVVMVDQQNSRIVFCIARDEMIIIGTTDTDFKESPDNVFTTTEDVKYLLKMCNMYFPKANIKKEDIVASYAGVRPLVDDGSDSVNATSRECKIISDSRNITFVAGGKYTNYRKTSKEVVDKILKNYEFQDLLRFKPDSNSKQALNPRATLSCFVKSRNMVSYWSKESGLTLDEVEYLQKKYYMETEDILGYEIESYNLLGLEVEHAMRKTMCTSLIDFFLRRTNMFFSLPDNAKKLYKKVAIQMAKRLSWSDKQMKDEIAKLERHIQLELGWKND